MEATIRHAVLEDLQQIIEIYNAAIPGFAATADTIPVTLKSRYQWFHQHSSHKRPLWILETKTSNIIGWLSLQDFYGRPAYNSTAEISIYISCECCGKGYGKMLLTHCLNQAVFLHIKNFVGFIFSHNSASIRLFKNFGFECWGCLPDVAVLNGIKRTLKIFGKRIN